MQSSLRDLIASDLARFGQTYELRGQPFSKRRVFWESLLFKGGFQAVFLYRLSHWLYQKGWLHMAWFVARFNLAFTAAEIEFNAEIGPGMFIAHPGGIVIGRGTVIGSGATIFQGVTFGAESWHPAEIRKFPTVGDNCFFFAHSTILGGIVIKDYSVIAAQTVVTCDMPGGSLAVGVPAKTIPHKGREMIESLTPHRERREA